MKKEGVIVVFVILFIIINIDIIFALQFGGMYQLDHFNHNRCRYPNPITNACTCPTGYSAQFGFGHSPTDACAFIGDHDGYYCYKDGIGGLYEFGGIFGYRQDSSDSQVGVTCGHFGPLLCEPNFNTNDCSCPSGYTAYQISGDPNDNHTASGGWCPGPTANPRRFDYIRYYCMKINSQPVSDSHYNLLGMTDISLTAIDCPAVPGNNLITIHATCNIDDSIFYCHSSCSQKTCTDLNAQCGLVDNGCGTPINCGTCSGGLSCLNGRCQDLCLGKEDNVGLYNQTESEFYFKNSKTSGNADKELWYGPRYTNDLPVVGDWDGDGVKTQGIYNPNTATFYLRNSNTEGYADITFMYGNPNSDWIPISGDWNGDGLWEIGLYDPDHSSFYLKNNLTSPASGMADITFGFGPAGAYLLPITGDWDGDGKFGVGVYSTAGSIFYLRNSLTTGMSDIAFAFGVPNLYWYPVAGDWNNDGKYSLGLFDNTTGIFYLRNNNQIVDANDKGYAEIMLTMNQAGKNIFPVSGKWCRTGDACPLSQIIVGLDRQVNSSLSTYNQGKNYNVCFSTIFGYSYTGLNPQACTNIDNKYNNTLFYLKSLQDSTISFESAGAYRTPICYGNLSCRTINVSKSESCSASQGEKSILSFSLFKDCNVSKINQSNTEELRLCCRENFKSPPAKVAWQDMNGDNITSADYLDRVKLGLYREFLIGRTINFTIYKSINGTYYPNEALNTSVYNQIIANTKENYTFVSWRANDTGKYYFTVQVMDNQFSNQIISSELIDIRTTQSNSPPTVYFLQPEKDSGYSISSTTQLTSPIPFNAVYRDPDDDLNISYDTGDSAITGFSYCLTNFNCNTTHVFNKSGTKIIKVIATELERGQETKNYTRIFVYSEGLNAFAIIDQPNYMGVIKDSGIYTVSGESSFVANCSYNTAVLNMTALNMSRGVYNPIIYLGQNISCYRHAESFDNGMQLYWKINDRQLNVTDSTPFEYLFVEPRENMIKLRLKYTY